jgi:DNA ligase (NAD+)
MNKSPVLNVSYPTACPSCGANTVVKLPHLICPNANCPPKLSGLLEHAAKRSQLDIVGLGAEVADALVSAKLVFNLADIFKLEEHTLSKMPFSKSTFGPVRTAKLLASIQKASEKPWSTVLHSLGCPGLGEPECEQIASLYSLHDLVAVMSPALIKMKLMELRGIGERTAIDFVTWLEVNADWLYEIATSEAVYGRVWLQTKAAAKETKNLPLLGYTVVLTGTFSKSRDMYKKQLKDLGAVVSDSVSKKTTVVFAGEDPGTNKIEAAAKNNILVKNENNLNKLLQEYIL